MAAAKRPWYEIGLPNGQTLPINGDLLPPEQLGQTPLMSTPQDAAANIGATPLGLAHTSPDDGIEPLGTGSPDQGQFSPVDAIPDWARAALGQAPAPLTPGAAMGGMGGGAPQTTPEGAADEVRRSREDAKFRNRPPAAEIGRGAGGALAGSIAAVSPPEEPGAAAAARPAKPGGGGGGVGARGSLTGQIDALQNKQYDSAREAADVEAMSALEQARGVVRTGEIDAEAYQREQGEIRRQEEDTKRAVQDTQSMFDEWDKAETEAASKKVDPSRYWRERSGFAKVLGMLSAALSGYASGLSGKGGNEYLDRIDREVERDIAAQEMDIKQGHARAAGKRNMLQQYVSSFGSPEAAKDALRAMYWRDIQREAESKQGKNRSEQAIAAAQQTAQMAQLKAEDAITRAKQLELQQRLAMMQRANAARARSRVPKPTEEQRNVAEAAAKRTNEQATKLELSSQRYEEATKESKGTGYLGRAWGTITGEEGARKAKAGMAALEGREGFFRGVMGRTDSATETDAARLEGAIPSPDSLTPGGQAGAEAASARLSEARAEAVKRDKLAQLELRILGAQERASAGDPDAEQEYFQLLQLRQAAQAGKVQLGKLE